MYSTMMTSKSRGNVRLIARWMVLSSCNRVSSRNCDGVNDTSGDGNENVADDDNDDDIGSATAAADEETEDCVNSERTDACDGCSSGASIGVDIVPSTSFRFRPLVAANTCC